MGGGASTSSNRRQKRQREGARADTLRSVERFIVNVYATCPRVEAIILLLNFKRGSQAFKSFLTAEKAVEVISCHTEIHAIIASNDTNQYTVFKKFERLYKMFIADASECQVMISQKLKETATLMLQADQDNPEIVVHLNELFTLIEEDLILIMARDHFYRFLQSKYYKKWRSQESSHAIAHTVEDAIGVDIREKGSFSVRNNQQLGTTAAAGRGGAGGGGRTQRLEGRSIRKSSFSIRERTKDSLSSHNDFTIGAFNNIDVTVIDTILAAKSWLSCLLAAVETLPLCFTLSIVRNGTNNYPIVFCNHYYEKKSGFTSRDILGKTLNFMLPPDSDKGKCTPLYDSIKAGERNSILLETRTNVNIKMKTVVGMRPIHNEKKKLIYVISTYMDVSKDTDDIDAKIALSNDLLDMLPLVLLVDAPPEDEERASCLPMRDLR